MATQLPRSQDRSVPPRNEPPTGPTVPGDETVTPFGPVADTPGRPFIHPHRMAQATRDQEMIDAIDQRLGKRVHIDINELRYGHRKPEQWVNRQSPLDLICYLALAFAVSFFVAVALGVLGQS